MTRTDAVTVEWYPEFRDGMAVPIVASMKIGERRFAAIDPGDRKALVDIAQAAASAAGVDPGVDISAVIGAVREVIHRIANPAPPRIDEPDTWGIVEASCVHHDLRREWIKYTDGNWYTLTGPASPDDWDSLIDPVLVREGVAS